MSQHDYVLDNANGATFRADLNGALAAIVGQNSGATAPTVPYAYMLWTDTSTSPATLRMRDGSNAAWLNVGKAVANFGLQPAGNYVYFDATTGAATLPAGSNAQRPAVPVSGQLRFNTASLQFEGYNGVLWSGIGGAGNAILDPFNGTGSQTVFTLSADPGSANSTTVVIGGTVQMKSTYTVSGTTLTFSGAPPAGTGNIEVSYYGALTIGTPADGSVTTLKIADANVTTEKIADAAVTDNKISAMAASKLTGDVAAARIVAALNASGTAPIYACRAWVNFNGTGTVAIRASGNVSSITDNGTGDYTVNFATAMSDANYGVVCTGSFNSGGLHEAIVYSPDAINVQIAGSVRVKAKQVGLPNVYDILFSNISIFR